MKIAVVQSRPVVGPVERNLPAHQSLIELAIRNEAKMIVFPEMSLTGYEPRLATTLARMPEDPCFDGLQSTADQHGVAIVVGVPTFGRSMPRISALVFRPESKVLVYSKQHLHKDEVPFFEPGPESNGVIHEDPVAALAICYELSVPAHARKAVDSGATVYLASVAKTARGVDDACRRLSAIAREHSIVVMMANCLGLLDDAQCTGGTSAWSRNGKCLMQLDCANEGILVLNCQTEDVLAAVRPTNQF